MLISPIFMTIFCFVFFSVAYFLWSCEMFASSLVSHGIRSSSCVTSNDTHVSSCDNVWCDVFDIWSYSCDISVPLLKAFYIGMKMDRVKILMSK